jgi:hypothetical protein
MAESGTKILADELVQGLRKNLSHVALPSDLWSVCICGSYARGDFMDYNSDLDFVLIGAPHVNGNPDTSVVRKLANDILAGRRFHSHNPQQFDWVSISWDALPKAGDVITLPESGPPVFRLLNIFLFDFVENLLVLWGMDPREILTAAPDVRDLAPAWFARARHNQQRHLDEHNEFRLVFSAFNSTHVAQIVFGERTLDKRYHLDLYRKYVPDFPLKNFGCELIEAKLRQRYPDDPARFAPWEKYIAFESELAKVVERGLRKKE